MISELLIPDKVYIYVPIDDIIATCILYKKVRLVYSSNTQNIIDWKVQYKSKSYVINFDLQEGEDENWNETYDEDGLCIYRKLDDAVAARQKFILKQYLSFSNKLYCKPKYE